MPTGGAKPWIHTREHEVISLRLAPRAKTKQCFCKLQPVIFSDSMRLQTEIEPCLRHRAWYHLIVLIACLCWTIPLLAQGRWRSAQEATDNGRIFYEDHFDTYRNFVEGVSGPCRIGYAADGLDLAVIPPGDNCVFSLWAAGYFSGSVRLDVHVKMTGGPTNLGYGMVFGEQQKQNVLGAYFYVVNADGKYALLVQKKNKWDAIIPWTFNRNIKQGIGNENHLTAEISGRSINLYVSGKKLDSAMAAADVHGYMGLMCDAKAAFRLVRVSEFYKPGGGELEHVFSIKSNATNDEEPSQNGNCAFGHSGDYYTISVLTSRGGPCFGSASTEMKGIQVQTEEPPGPEHLFLETTAGLLRGAEGGGYGLQFSISYAGLETRYHFEISGNGWATIGRCKGVPGKI